MKKTQYEKLKDPHDAPYRKNDLIDGKQPTHNAGKCDGCGETVKPDQWSKDIREQVFLCIDCA